MSEESTPARPLLRVVKGAPTAAELAALVAVASARAAAGGEPPPPDTSTWGDRASALRGELRTGPNAWVRGGGMRTRADW